jgi:NAD(P)-dependent dehydrogenase (short-subunit alcohol dehydrogenase family)
MLTRTEELTMGLLDGRVALVTGGGGEIGGATARLFAREGALIAVADLRGEAAEAAAADITSAGGRAIAIAADISKPAEAKRAVDETIAAYGKLTIYVNTPAAVTPDSLVEDLPFELWNEALAVNLSAAFLMAKYAIPSIRAAGGGTMVLVASQLGQIGVPLRSPYSTTKAALIQFAKCLAVDHAKDNIRVNTISPGSINTARTLRRFGTREAGNRIRGPAHLLGRTGEAHEIADGCLFLASEQSSFMTGADLLMDGGYLAFKGMRRPEGDSSRPN